MATRNKHLFRCSKHLQMVTRNKHLFRCSKHLQMVTCHSHRLPILPMGSRNTHLLATHTPPAHFRDRRWKTMTSE